MGHKSGQYEFNFGEDKKRNPTPAPEVSIVQGADIKKIEVHPNDECTACGNPFESMSPGCPACRSNKAKIAWRIKNQGTH